MFSEIKKSIFVSIWFMFLTFPIMVIKVNTIENTIIWRWKNLIIIGLVSFFLSFLWRFMQNKKSSKRRQDYKDAISKLFYDNFIENKKVFIPIAVILLFFILLFPKLFSTYQVTIMTTAMIYIVLGLGLNVVVGFAGLLDLGYVAFYAVGAYTYGLLNYNYDISFWVALPLAGILASLAGILLGFPVLRLRGDYLAIVTLGFGEIIRLVLENWGEVTHGPSGIAGIDRPNFGFNLSIIGSINAIYYLVFIFVIITIFFTNRLQNSRIGRAWVALREDEIACQAMGVDRTKTKLSAFAFGATWAGFMGAMFAAKTTFINPASFTFLESAIILSIVVLGGMGSIPGVILGALILILLPEYLRAFSEYRMLIFGGSMVLMMVFRPQGLIKSKRQTYDLKEMSKKIKMKEKHNAASS
jgi:branched-chain amino acid transport system permease protein